MGGGGVVVVVVVVVVDTLSVTHVTEVLTGISAWAASWEREKERARAGAAAAAGKFKECLVTLYHLFSVISYYQFLVASHCLFLGTLYSLFSMIYSL